MPTRSYPATVVVSSAHGRLISRATNAEDRARMDSDVDAREKRVARRAYLLAEYSELGLVVKGSDITFKNPNNGKWGRVRSWADFKMACHSQAWRTETARLGYEPREGRNSWRISPAQWTQAARDIVADRVAMPSWMVV